MGNILMSGMKNENKVTNSYKCRRGHVKSKHQRTLSSGRKYCLKCHLIRQRKWYKKKTRGLSNPDFRPLQLYCVNGHLLSANTLYKKDRGEFRPYCAACGLASQRRYRDKLKTNKTTKESKK